MLSSGSFTDQSRISLSPTMHSMYFGEMNVSYRVKEYLSIAQKFIDERDSNKIDMLIEQIDSKSEPLLKDLNAIVKQYQLEGEMRLENMEVIETIAWIVTIITLILEALFIFRPMINKIILLNREKDNIVKDLENTVELRTEHLKKANSKLSFLAHHDTLTGLRNRLDFEQDIQVAIDMYEKHRAPYGVLMFDIDWFKSINDTYGHDVGDKVLVDVSDILVSSVREEDKVYRAGGEEFVILLNRISYKGTVLVAEKIRKLIESHIFKAADDMFSKTISGGLFHSSISKAIDVKSLLKLIDNALYSSKVNGRNQITIAKEHIEKKNEKVVIPSIQIIFLDTSLNKAINVLNDNINREFFKPEELLTDTKYLLDSIHPEDKDILNNIPLNATKSEPYISTIRLVNKNEKIHIYRVEAYINSDANLIVSFQDSVNLANPISDSTHIINLHAMLENTDDFIYFKDRNHLMTDASKTLVAMTTADSREELIGKMDYELFDRDLADKYFSLERKVFDGELKVAQEIQPTVDNDGNHGYVDNRKYPIHDEKGKVVGLFGIARIVKK